MCNLSRHGLHHLPPDGSALRGLSIRGLLDLIGLALGEPNAEHTKKVAIGGLDVHICLY